MIHKQLTAEQRLSKAMVDIMAQPKYVALAGVLMIGERTIDETCPTAYTNGRDEGYGRAFVDSLNDAELRFLILHENYHKLYQHLTTWDYLYKEDGELANRACDYVINLKIRDENRDGFATMPKVGCIDERFRGMNTLQVYKLLKEDQEQDDGGDEAGDSGDELGNAPNKPAHGEGMDSHDWEGAQQLSEADKRELAQDLDEAIRQGALMAGKVGTGGERLFDELLQPTIDWREVLREFISTTCAGNDYSTWRRPNRRFIGAGVYLSSGISEAVGELVVAIDTSGSIGARELRLFLSEVQGIARTVNPDKIRLLYWDTTICSEEIYLPGDMDQLALSTKPKGGGGTLIECVPTHLTKSSVTPQAVIVLTDGYLGGTWGSWSAPVLWCLLDNPGARPNVGKAVHITSSDF